MALQGQPILDHKPNLVWENNPDTPITATALSKSCDLSISYLDFKYNDPQNLLHREGTILLADPDTSHQPIKLVMKRGVIFSIINQVDTVTYPNGQYKIFDSGLDDLWITYDNKDNQSKTTIEGWGQNKQWFVFICDERINNPETGDNTAQIIISQSNLYPQNTQIPGTSDYFSALDTRLIGGFKSNSSSNIIRESVWDISGKFHTVKAKQYMVLDEYAVSSIDQQHIYRPLRISDLDSTGITSSVDGDMFVSGNTELNNNLSVQGITTLNKLQIYDNNNIIHEFIKNPDGLSSGVSIKTITNPSSSQPIFTVTSSGNSERLRVEHDGKLSTSNNTISINGVDITKGLTEPTSTTALGVEAYLYATRVYNAVYNDLAEYFLSIDGPIPGKVYSLYKECNLHMSNKKGDKKVIGVCSDTPAFVMKQEYEKSGGVPIALSGTVKVWAKGVIKEGDELQSDKDGFACKAGIITRLFKRRAIIGMALETSLDKNEKRVLILVR